MLKFDSSVVCVIRNSTLMSVYVCAGITGTSLNPIYGMSMDPLYGGAVSCSVVSFLAQHK